MTIVDGLSFIMRNNIFGYRDLYFKQKQGTTIVIMGACVYATMYYGYYEKNSLCPNIRILNQYIGEMIVIWMWKAARLEQFQADLPY